jgi:formylglycine-generating enzyme required for sulfatase activity/serine/threonine protein kinase
MWGLHYNRGALAEPPVDRYALVGTIVADKYAIERVVGEGGFGVVFRATHRIWDEPVALKCFTALSNAPIEMRDELLDQFVQEGKLLTKLSSRTTGIVQARDIGTLTTPGGAWLPYMVLEWLDGRTLESFLGHDGEVPLGAPRGVFETFQVMDGVARALALAHAGGVAHRDIKPANFFVLGQELAPGVVIKMLDFGIAKVMQQQSQGALKATGAQISSFTPSYGAPEQFDRSYGATGPWTDVYQMALVLVEMMRGGVPALSGDGFIQLAFASQNPDRRPTPRSFGLDVAEPVEAVFRKAMALQVSDRYANMSEFWGALALALGLRDYAPMPTDTSVAPITQSTLGPDVSHARVASKLVASPVTQPRPPATVVNTSGPRVKPARTGGRAAVWAAAGLLVAAGAAYAAVRAFPGDTPPPPPTGPTPTPTKPPEPPPGPPVATPPTVTPCPSDMVLVEGGRFFMGSDAEDPVLAAARPAHKVEVARFCLDRYEVTAAAYEKCSASGNCKRAFTNSWWPQGAMTKAEWVKARKAYSALCNQGVAARADHPVNCVDWAQADEYCRQQGKRLPWEKEFEFAARGSDGRVYPWGDDPPSQRHLNGCGRECVEWRAAAGLPPVKPLYDADDGFPGTAPIGSYPAGKTQAGLLDVVGNVFEWTADAYSVYPQAGGAPATTPPSDNRVIRGGAFNSFEPAHTDPALRLPYDASAHTHGIGFRCAADPRG